MKSINLILSLLATALLAMILVSCNKDDVSSGGAELSALTYSTGEVALGATYVSAPPSIFATSAPTYSIIKVSHNGKVIDNTSPQIATIDPTTGVITATTAADVAYVGDYLVSVRVKNSATSADFADVFRLAVKGITFDGDITVAQGSTATIPAEGIHFAQGSGTSFYLSLPKGATEEDYNGITVGKDDCAITVAATANAGVYPINIRVENLTNKAVVFANVVKVVVESKPYGLTYTPATITLVTKEGHQSPVPTIKAASAQDGSKVTYELVNSPSDQFVIDAATGVISIEEDNTLEATLMSYNLSVKATNNLGSATFNNVYTIVVDPNKPIEAITNITYTDEFPVELEPGQPWTSSSATITGSTIGREFSLTNAPAGVTIDAKTGAITFAAGHSMPLLTENNKLTVSVKNSGMQTGVEFQIGDFSIDKNLWNVEFQTNAAADALTNSGIKNMDRYSFLGRMFQPSSTSIQVKNGWGIASARTMIQGLNCTTAESAKTDLQWNNDWLVSAEIEIGEYALNPKLLYLFAAQYGGNAASLQTFNVYVKEITSSDIYVTGAQEQGGTVLDLARTPSNLDWGLPVVSSTTAEGVAATPAIAKSISLSAYKGKKIRVAFQYYNTANDAANTRSYSIQNLRVEDSLVP